MKLQEIQLAEFAPQDRWKELEKLGKDLQLFFRLGHLNPECHADPVYSQANKVLKQEQRGNVAETTSTVGIFTKKGKLSDFYDGMIACAKAGLLKSFTVNDIIEHRNKMNKATPEECDFWSDITVADYKEEKSASCALENLANQFTKGFANVPIPGASGNMTLKDVFKNPLVRAEAKKRGVDEAKMDEALEQITKASSQAIEQTAKMNVKYNVGKFDKYPAVYCIPPSLPKSKPKPRKKSTLTEVKLPDGSVRKFQAGGGSDTRVKLPANAFDKEDLPIGGHVLQAFQVGNYLISGGILTALYYMPTGKSFCQSLTKFKTTTETTREGDMTFIDHFIVPENSNLATEGYLNREEAEEMIVKLASLLK